MKESERLQRKRKFFNVLQWIALSIAILCAIGLLVSIILLGIGKGKISLTGGLSGGFLAGILIFGAISYWLFRIFTRISDRELDALEREDDKNSFFVGEGTLATLNDGEMLLHGGEKQKRISVPYSAVRFISVCTRRSPAEKGEWSVLFELPARYLNPKADAKEKPVLIQTDGKERLYARLKELSLELLGEQPGGSKPEDGEKFILLHKFKEPDRAQRVKSIAIMAIGGVLAVLGVLIMAFGDRLFAHAATMGSIAFVLGVYFLLRGMYAFVKAKSLFEIFAEGIYYTDSRGADSVFLKWEEIKSVEKLVREDGSVLRVGCLYGNYDFPLFEGAYEMISERRSAAEEKA